MNLLVMLQKNADVLDESFHPCASLSDLDQIKTNPADWPYTICSVCFLSLDSKARITYFLPWSLVRWHDHFVSPRVRQHHDARTSRLRDLRFSTYFLNSSGLVHYHPEHLAHSLTSSSSQRVLPGKSKYRHSGLRGGMNSIIICQYAGYYFRVVHF